MAAMSGGVDSSVCALLLRQAGCDVRGATMVLHGDVAAGAGGAAAWSEGAVCGSSRDVEDARAVCRHLGIPHDAFDLRDRFDAAVVRPFCEAYLTGRTPNPCIDCNRYLKFEALQQRRRELGLQYVATGHYARRRWDEASGRWQLLRAADVAKDQSYVLYHLTQDTLAHMLFPLGDLTKNEVRALARDHGFTTADKPESQDICFVPDGDYVSFIEGWCRVRDCEGAVSHASLMCGTEGGLKAAPTETRSAGMGENPKAALAEAGLAIASAADAFAPGEIVDHAGRVLGQHAGLIHYTVGQRKGIGVAAREPLYVLGKDNTANRLVVGFRDELESRGVVARDVNLIGGDALGGPRRVRVKTHYRQRPVDATVEQTGPDELTVVFAEPQRAAAPGQAVVVYDGELVIGGGTAARSF
ncbi:tRNA 2-thiouridine(34) synthase MnmA [Adlercreutzia sp. R21]|uniref:MnmA/TRMU family protein n=1 Tax=Adlercreutzia wanghongyangiae TaxID=3111451 RepID=UPI002DBBF1BE|nr:tRNA 2-thiouridine(34) synthase MnmA [Adlercreutzia sp. R21]MEC4185278.1 tRNA 2-thiouridine(34) synthase MnmA [Adlercreutzia sp. R21]